MKQNQIKEDHTNVLNSHQASFVEFSPLPTLVRSFVLRMHLSLADDLGENLNIFASRTRFR